MSRQRKKKAPARRFPRFRQHHPQAKIWLNAGLYPANALALVEAGFRSLADLEGAPRAEILAIPNVGVNSLEVIEQLLGRPLLWPRKRQPQKVLQPVLPEDAWRLRGLSSAAAITFAQVGMTLERLKEMTREELLSLRGVGPKSLHACELLLGRKMPSQKPGDPIALFWRSQGILDKAAKALSQAGLSTLEEIGKSWREDLLSLRKIGGTTLARLEVLLGAKIPSRAAYWRGRGVHALIANALVRQRIYTLEDLGRLTREQFLYLPGLGPHTLRQCEKLLGRELPSRPDKRHGR